MSESVAQDEHEEPQPPRLRIAKGSPWRIDAGRRAKWSAPAFVSAHAVDVRQIGDPVLARLVALDINGKKFVVEGEEFGAQCMLHETDHLNGILYVDRLKSRDDLHPVEVEEPADSAQGERLRS